MTENILNLNRTYSPRREMEAFEALVSSHMKDPRKVSRSILDSQMLPSELASELNLDQKMYSDVVEFLSSKTGFSIATVADYQYPKLAEWIKYPMALFYYKGALQLLDSRCVSVVGSRKASKRGLEEASRIGYSLAENGYTVVSGLAEGIDTAALTSSLAQSGDVIAVIGTPIDEYYPKKNRDLQDYISKHSLLISHVPFLYYKNAHFQVKRRLFPARNEVMSAISEATIIVEAGTSSGTLTQAKACLDQGRKLFILDFNFDNPHIDWPERFEKLGAVRVSSMSEILDHLGEVKHDTGETLEEDRRWHP